MYDLPGPNAVDVGLGVRQIFVKFLAINSHDRRSFVSRRVGRIFCGQALMAPCHGMFFPIMQGHEFRKTAHPSKGRRAMRAKSWCG